MSDESSPRLVLKNTFLTFEGGQGHSRSLQRSASAPSRCFLESGDLASGEEGGLVLADEDPPQPLAVQEPPANSVRSASVARAGLAVTMGASVLEASAQTSVPNNAGKGSHSEALHSASDRRREVTTHSAVTVSTQQTHSEQRRRLQQAERRENTQQPLHNYKGPAYLEHLSSAMQAQPQPLASTQQAHGQHTANSRQVQSQTSASSTGNKLRRSTRAKSAGTVPSTALRVGEQVPAAMVTLQHEAGRYVHGAAPSTGIIHQRFTVPASPAAAGGSARAANAGYSAKGATGSTSAKGATGSTSAKGATGSTSAKGATGGTLTPKGVGKISVNVIWPVPLDPGAQMAAAKNELQVPAPAPSSHAVGSTVPAVAAGSSADDKLLQHAARRCTPCAYFRVKADGCRRGEACEFCHICTLSDVRARKALVKREARNPTGSRNSL
eukprot:TRINITY_DN750_c0_g1_i1.p1 TRINITY_DN750_c0_g1~~TRINITY_DN750_c0_g1_i1.p1  ORF type:complete len:440 (-),score=42.51 TRINITY_DN750_c0_g1_i1:82-1401(-)